MSSVLPDADVPDGPDAETELLLDRVIALRDIAAIEAMRHEGLDSVEFVVLRTAIRSAGPIDRGTLTAGGSAEVEEKRTTALSALLDRGALSESDGIVSVTEAGARLDAGAASALRRVSARLVDGIPPDELAATHAVLRRMLDNLQPRRSPRLPHPRRPAD